MSCAHCRDAKSFFGPGPARWDLWRYRRFGPHGTTRDLLDAVRSRAPGAGYTVLDVGSGVGAVVHELLGDGAGRAVSVDASPAYARALAEEARRRGHDDRVEQREGDFVELADEVEPAEVVTLDRVVCCYPDMPALVGASARRARRLYGLAIPREVWWVRMGVRVINALQRLRGSDFRVFVHPTGAVIAAVEEAGLRQVEARRRLNWNVLLFERTGDPEGGG